MLSILIPTYNYNTLPLVKELHDQALREEIVFEIIVLDDASTNIELIRDNYEINQLSDATFESNYENLGRGRNLNKLVAKAQYDWVLIMDCDTFPSHSFFLKKYIDAILIRKSKIIFGGISYQDNIPHDDELFRWVYGRKREAIALEARLRQPYEHVLTSNILVSKEIMKQFPFPDFITTYGFEDLVFVLKLKENNFLIHHIDNTAFHLNLEKSTVFLNKYNSSLKNLKYLLNKKIILENDTRLTKLYALLKRVRLLFLVRFIFKISRKLLLKNLVSKKPSLLLFDFYKLGYFSMLDEIN